MFNAEPHIKEKAERIRTEFVNSLTPSGKLAYLVCSLCAFENCRNEVFDEFPKHFSKPRDYFDYLIKYIIDNDIEFEKQALPFIMDLCETFDCIDIYEFQDAIDMSYMVLHYENLHN